jgi:hypothetical protein
MKTIIEQTPVSATYEFSSGDSKRVVVYSKTDFTNPETIVDFDVIATFDHDKWLSWLGSNNN